MSPSAHELQIMLQIEASANQPHLLAERLSHDMILSSYQQFFPEVKKLPLSSVHRLNLFSRPIVEIIFLYFPKQRLLSVIKLQFYNYIVTEQKGTFYVKKIKEIRTITLPKKTTI